MKIGIVGCSKTKAEQSCKAKDMFRGSTSFRYRVKYAEKYLDDWMVLSAKYGLIHKDKIIDPYSLTLPNKNGTRNPIYHKEPILDSEYMNGWNAVVTKQIFSLKAIPVYLAGKSYWQGLPRGETPLLNMRFGTQLKWLKERCEE